MLARPKLIGAILATGAALTVALRFGMASAAPSQAPGTIGRGLSMALRLASEPPIERLRARRELAERRARFLAEHIRTMPDWSQTDPDLGLPGGGLSHCGPVAVANGLAWLADRGHDAILPAASSDRARQIQLIRRLGSGHYMATGVNAGTGAAGLLTGLERYLKRAGLKPKRLAYQGWRGHPRRFSTGIKTPELGFVRDAMARGGAAWLNVGWYQPSPRGGVWRRRGGHWLTVVGLDVNERGDSAPGTLVVHDPAPWAGAELRRHFAHFAPVGEGWLIAEAGAFPAKGHHSLNGILVKHQGDVAIVDGAVVLEL